MHGNTFLSTNETLVSGSHPRHLSAHAAELVAPSEACKLAEGKSASIHTDSHYAFWVVYMTSKHLVNKGIFSHLLVNNHILVCAL